MRLFIGLVLALWSVTAAAFDPTRWIYVKGGTWIPSPTELRKIEEVLKPAAVGTTRDAGQPHAWEEYRFQFQGRTDSRGRKFVFVNAFCNEPGSANLAAVWVGVAEVAGCYFSAKYDSEERRVYEFRQS